MNSANIINGFASTTGMFAIINVSVDLNKPMTLETYCFKMLHIPGPIFSCICVRLMDAAHFKSAGLCGL